MSNINIVDYAKQKMNDNGLPMDMYEMVIKDAAIDEVKDIDGRINLLINLVDQRTNEEVDKRINKNPWSTETLNLTEQGKILKENPKLAEELKKAAKKNIIKRW